MSLLVCISIYSNTRHPKFAKYSVIAGIILSFVCFALYATIDEEADTITSSEQKKYPMKISKLTTITYKESKKGKFRSLQIHDSGVGFLEMRVSKKNADLIVAQLTKVNPSIEVKHANYI